jgi:LPS-assembly lipoprotein
MAGDRPKGDRPKGAPARRALLRGAAGLLALGAGGCGFRPLYRGPGAVAGDDPALAEELAATRVAPIPERFGQLLHRGLQQRLRAPAGTLPARWELVVGPSLAAESLGIERDGAATRVRYIATANWTLLRLTPREPVASGFERRIDAFNVRTNQYFAADTSREATERRLAEQLADEVVTRLAVRLRGLRETGAPQLIPPVATPPGVLEPPRPLGGALPLPGPAGLPEGGLGGGLGETGLIR